MIKAAEGEAVNKWSSGCSANGLQTIVSTIAGFPYDLRFLGMDTPSRRITHQAALDTLAAECKKWKQGTTWNPGSAVFCVLTKNQLDAKRVLEENGFEELGRTISAHIWGFDMNLFAQTLDAPEVIYLMGKGWYHSPKEK